MDAVKLLDDIHREDLQCVDSVVVGFAVRGDLDGAGSVDARARGPEQTVQ
ncbi:hypothetical protein ACIQPR_09785 [Streptomyces sp. NPDC091280]